jgi:broad specificity phosphatase PhoE
VAGSLLVVRHGETEWNLQRRYQGRSDSPLTERGIAQARAIGQLFASLPEIASAGIVASPIGRARSTAELICEHLPPSAALHLDDRLCELSLGSWDGLTYQQIEMRVPGVFDGDGRHEWYFRSPDGERYHAFAARLSAWLKDWDERRVLVVVTHGIVTRVLRGLYAGLPRAVALMLPVPQDKVYRLSGGAIEQLPSLAPVARTASQNCSGSKSSTVALPQTP